MAENARVAGSPAPGTLRPLSLPTHHPAQPQAGLAGSSDSDAGRSRVGRRLQRLDDPGRRAGGAGPHDVALPHAEPGGAARGQSRRAGAGVRGGRGRAGAPRRSLRGSCVSPSCHLVSMKTQMTHAALFPKRRPRAINVLRVGRAVSRVGAWAGGPRAGEPAAGCSRLAGAEGGLRAQSSGSCFTARKRWNVTPNDSCERPVPVSWPGSHAPVPLGSGEQWRPPGPGPRTPLWAAAFAPGL